MLRAPLVHFAPVKNGPWPQPRPPVGTYQYLGASGRGGGPNRATMFSRTALSCFLRDLITPSLPSFIRFAAVSPPVVCLASPLQTSSLVPLLFFDIVFFAPPGFNFGAPAAQKKR
jgi:hypothetical protein